MEAITCLGTRSWSGLEKGEKDLQTPRWTGLTSRQTDRCKSTEHTFPPPHL